jgi:hypothetical protein
MTAAFTDLRAAETSVKTSCVLTGMSRATHYRHANPKGPVHGPWLPRTPPPQALDAAERARVLAVLTSPAYRDLAIGQVWARELDESQYWCSVSTMYRVARAAGQVRERRRLATHPTRVRPELLARGPSEVWSWDITALKGPTKGTWYKCYVILDIYSRYVTGWLVTAIEDAVMGERLPRRRHQPQQHRPAHDPRRPRRRDGIQTGVGTPCRSAGDPVAFPTPHLERQPLRATRSRLKRVDSQAGGRPMSVA